MGGKNNKLIDKNSLDHWFSTRGARTPCGLFSFFEEVTRAFDEKYINIIFKKNNVHNCFFKFASNYQLIFNSWS